MDATFADRMADLGEIDSETLNGRWAAVVSVAGAASASDKARLVLIACREPVDRGVDEWFWMPFRAADDTFRVDDAVELHARLADAAVRYLLEQGDRLVPLLVRLSALAGFAPVNAAMPAAADAALHETPRRIEPAVASKTYWTKSDQDKTKVDGGLDLVTLGAALDSVAINSQNAIAGLWQAMSAVTSWASDAERRFSNEHGLVQWLLGGVRRDGVAWNQLSACVAAIDAGLEIATFVGDAPQQRHEAVLGQVLATSGVPDSPTTWVTDGLLAAAAGFGEPALARLSPIAAALAGGFSLEELRPYEIARRAMWESVAARRWAEA